MTIFSAMAPSFWQGVENVKIKVEKLKIEYVAKKQQPPKISPLGRLQGKICDLRIDPKTRIGEKLSLIWCTALRRDRMAKPGKEVILGGLTAVVAAAAGAQAAVAADVNMAPADDWTGLYLGVGIGMMGGDFPVHQSSDYKLRSDPVFGGFIGYNQEMSNGFVLGGELALQTGPNSRGGSPTDDYDMRYVADAKVKLGMAMDNWMPYLFAGISGDGITTGSSHHDYTNFGVNYGLGADFKVSEQFTIGAEVMGRTFLDVYSDTSDGHDVTDFQGTLRAAFHF